MSFRAPIATELAGVVVSLEHLATPPAILTRFPLAVMFWGYAFARPVPLRFANPCPRHNCWRCMMPGDAFVPWPLP